MIKFFKKEKSFKKANLHLSPNLFWKLSILFIFILSIFSYFLGYYLFKQVNKEPVLEMNNNNSQIETIKKDRIEKVLGYFSTRQQESNKILNSFTSVIDPSL